MMATNGKYQNISIQPTTVPRTSKTVYELPRENLTEDELYRKSTSDKTKRRVAHKAWFPLPVITKPFFAEKTQRKQKIKQVIKNKITRENLNEDEPVRKYTSDGIKRDVALKACCFPPIITEPAVVAEKPQRKRKLNQVIVEVVPRPAVVAEKPQRKRKLNQVIVESIFIRKVRQMTIQHAVIAGTEQSYRQVETSSSIEEVYEIVKKSEDLDDYCRVPKRNKKV